MRNLTIERKKSVVASLATIDVYIQDPNSQEIRINDMPCRKLGELKNGEQKTFQIGDESTRIFVLVDKLSKGYCSEYYDVPAGTEDVYLSGKNELNPASGNAFRFDNNTSAGIKQYRKKGKTLGLIISIIAVIGGFFIGKYIIAEQIIDNININKRPSYNNTENENNNYNDILNNNNNQEEVDTSKNFYSNGMNVKLTTDFKETTMEGFDVAFESDKVLIIASNTNVSVESYPLNQYAQLTMQTNNQDPANLKTKDGLTYFEYDYSTFHYVVFVVEGTDNYWLVNFITQISDANDYSEQIIEWAKTINFN